MHTRPAISVPLVDRHAAYEGRDRTAGTRPAALSTSTAIQGIVLVLLMSTAATALVAWPVLAAPRTTIFGHEIVGRHYDPFLVMQQFEQGGAAGIMWQPLTDGPGALLSGLVGPVVAYNLVVLASFPLAALAAYGLALYLTGVHRAALVSALAFAFAPVQVAHAAYHPHIAQVQWIPLYLLALFAAIDRPGVRRIVLLLAAAAALVASNDYGGLIGLLTTPVAAGAYWITRPVAERTWRGLFVPILGLAIASAAVLVAAALTKPDALAEAWASRFPIADLSYYAARWQAFFLPPVDHVLAGDVILRVWRQLGVKQGLLEQQLYLGSALVLMACFGLRQAVHGGLNPRAALAVTALAILAAWSAVVSRAPFSVTLHAILPMFRAYARFGIVTVLCVAILAGIGLDALIEQGRSVRRGRRVAFVTASVLLPAIALVEFAPLPWRARDVLPTEAHRWMVEHGGAGAVLDCTPLRPPDATVPWLMGTTRIAFMAPPFEGCDDPLLADKATALGYAYVIRRGMNGPAALPSAAQPELPLVRAFTDSRVYAVPPSSEPVLTIAMRGYHAWESGAGEPWRWMMQRGWWTVRNRRDRATEVVLELDASAFDRPRTLLATVNGREAARITIEPAPAWYAIGPFTLPAGDSELAFTAMEPATRPDDVLKNGDTRYVTVMFRRWRWRTR